MKPIDPKAQALLTAIAAAGEPDIASIPLETARKEMDQGYAALKSPVKPVGDILDISIPANGRTIPLRIYKPDAEGILPVMIFIHGGGWVFYLREAYESICTHLCDATRSLVVSIDYRLAPENRFPAAVEDCVVATCWILEHCRQWGGDPSSVFLAGDSAGGNLAAVTAIRLRDEGSLALKGQVLIYPVTDQRDSGMPSYKEFPEGMGLTSDAMKWYWDHYLESPADHENPDAAPLLANDLTNLPPALVIVAGYDPVRDEGIAYARAMQKAGVAVQLTIYEDMIHGFLSYLGLLSQGHEAIGEIAAWMPRV